jgi:hypothetical protein
MTGGHKNNICPNCGYGKEPDTAVCPKCEFISPQIQPEHQNEEIEKDPKDNPTENTKPDIPEIKLHPSFGSKRNFLYNLNTKAINLVLFAIIAIITGILLFKYIMLLIASPTG